jgi:DNA replication protein DnaC
MSKLLQDETTETAVCPKHGEYTRKTGVIRALGIEQYIFTICPKCYKEIAAREEAEKQQARLERNRQILLKSGVTERFMSADFDDFMMYNPPAQQSVVFDCIDYAKRIDEVCKTGEGLFITGGVGTGKTHTAVAILKAALAKHKTARIYKTTALLRRIKDTYGRDATETETKILNELKDLDLLILDEFGLKSTREGEASETEKALLFEIIDTRYEAYKPTIIISNLNAKDRKEYLADDRISDRLKRNKELIFSWESYR